MAASYSKTLNCPKDGSKKIKEERPNQSCYSDDRYKTKHVFEEEDSELLLLLFDAELNVYNTKEENCKIVKKHEPNSQVSLLCLDEKVEERRKNDIESLLNDVCVCEFKSSNLEKVKQIKDLITEDLDYIKMKTYTNGDEQILQIFSKIKGKNQMVKTLEEIIGKPFTKRTSKNVDERKKDERTSIRIDKKSKSMKSDGINAEQEKAESSNTDKESNLSFPRGSENKKTKSKSTTQACANDGEVFNIKLPKGLTLKLVKGSIIHMNVDAIVNAANESLHNDGGVAYDISKAAGKAFDAECRDLVINKGSIPVTDNEITGAGNLKCHHVVHAVGPRWDDYKDNQKEECLDDVKQTVIGVLKIAMKSQFKSIAMPPISSGIFSVPKRLCAAMYVKAFLEYDEKFYSMKQLPKELILVDINDEILKIVQELCADLQNETKFDTKRLIYEYNQRNWMPCGRDHGHGSMMDPKGKFTNQHYGHHNKDLACEGIRNDTEMKGLIRDYTKDECRMIDDKTFVIGGELKVKIYTNDIVYLRGVDILVSAENRSVNGQGILASHILRNAGAKYQSEHTDLLGYYGAPKHFGEILITSAGKLGYKYVFHVVTDRFSDETNIHHQLPQAKTAMWNLLKKANEFSHKKTKSEKEKIKSMALALLGTGGVTKQSVLSQICGSVFDSIQMFVRNERVDLEEIHLVNVNKKITNILLEIFSSGVSNYVNKPTTRPLPLTPRPPPPDGNDLYCSNLQEKQHVYQWHIPRKRPFINTQQFMEPVTGSDRKRGQIEVNCVVCMDKKENPVQLIHCKHQFCKECISEYFSHKLACPVCSLIYGEIYGNQPENGTAYIYKNEYSLPGFQKSCTWIIRYVFPDGKQSENHPHPGTPYKGTQRIAYLPDTESGKKVLNMLEKAFKQKLIFTIGSSRTTGRDNVVTWNDIHHKTRRDGGPERFGYPDDQYLARVTDELEAKGIKP